VEVVKEVVEEGRDGRGRRDVSGGRSDPAVEAVEKRMSRREEWIRGGQARGECDWSEQEGSLVGRGRSKRLVWRAE
jgi:hypothetical protein